MATHALVTGPISGRIPVKDSHVDVTPHVLYFEHDDVSAPPQALLDVADAIEDEHYVRGTHPIELECQALDDTSQYPDLPDEVRARHRQMHADLHTKMANRGVSR
jgi:hypothetical protein